MARRISASRVEGLKRLADSLKDLKIKIASDEAFAVLGEVSKMGARFIRNETISRGWPHEVQEAIYYYNRPQPSSRGHVGTLFGIRKRGRPPYVASYVEWWGKTKSGKRSKVKVVGESLATMYEYGTSKTGGHYVPPRPAVRPAIQKTRILAPAILEAGFKRILEKYSKA